MKPLLSIVIPSLGNISNLKKLIDSVRAQGLSDYELEVLVVINGSLKIERKTEIEQWAKTYTEYVKLIFIASKGVNRARNYGLKNAKADILIFFDDDCVVESKNFLLKHLQFHQGQSGVFAYGGGYNLPEKPAFWDRMYNYLQMKWLYSGIIDEAGKLVHTRVLLGGNFSIKLNMVLTSDIQFDEAIVYGGSEYDFFKQARIKNLPMVLNSLNVNHNTCENLWSVTRKLYKQGRGKAHIDLKYGAADANTIKAGQETLPLLQRTVMLYFNYVFWAGYYGFNGKPFSFITHIVKDLIGSFNKARYDALARISRQISSKKDQGDRF